MDYKRHVEFFFLSLISGIAGLGTTFVAKMNDNVFQMTVAVKEIKVEMQSNNAKYTELLHDHELRIREMERMLFKK